MLVVKLPYPVQDTKGTAKYDKASKSLTVTLPVRPPPSVPVVSASSVAAMASSPPRTPSKGEAEGVEDANAETTSPAKPAAASSAIKKASLGHSRWVDGSNPASTTTPSATSSGEAAVGDATEEPPLSLHEQIKRQAEAALVQARAAAAAAPTKVEAAKSTLASAAAAPVSTSDDPIVFADIGVDFIAAVSFAGRKAGFVFKRGEQGVGYYRDLNQSIGTAKVPVGAKAAAPAAVASIETAPAAATATTAEFHAFPYECRQTKHALAVIVQVPRIDPTSVQVVFLPHAVHVAFRAFLDVTAEQEGGGIGGGIASRQYGAVFSLPEGDACAGGLDVSRCRYDAATHNMALVLTKQLPKYWSAGAGAGLTTTESKSGELDEDAMKLLTPSAYIQPPETHGRSARSSDTMTKEVPTPPPVSVPHLPTKAVDPEEAKATKALESAMQALQFSSSDALFELD